MSMLNIQRLLHGALRLRAKESKYVLAAVVVMFVYIMLVKIQIVSSPLEITISDTVSKTSLSIKDETDIFLDKLYQADKAKSEKKNSKSAAKEVDVEEDKSSDDAPSKDDGNEDPKQREKYRIEKEFKNDPCLSKTILESRYSSMKLKSFYGTHELSNDENYFLDLTCGDIEYVPEDADSQLEYTDSRLLDDDFESLNQYLRKTGYGSIIAGEDADLDSYDFSSLTDWYRFTGSSVWLPDQKYHLMMSRIVYSPNKIPLVSFIRLQLFDPNWKEIKGRRLRYVDIDDKELKSAVVNYERTKNETILDGISIKFPNILDINLDVESRSDLLGPEDPRILYKSTGDVHEPVAVFNQDLRGRRTMYATFPLRHTKPGHKKETLMLRTSLMGDYPFEKNWTPFFSNISPPPPPGSRGWMYMFYALDPLKIFKCDLDTGYCDIVQQNGKKTDIDRGGLLTSVRGATSLRSIPRKIVQRMLRRDGILDPDYPLEIWVGFVKTHIDECGCGAMLYRPNIMVLVRQENSFRIDLLSSSIDFGKDVMSWDDLTSTYCDDGNNVLNANEISFWHISDELPQDIQPFDPSAKEIPKYDDYMALTLSEADENVQVVFLRHVLNYVLGFYKHTKLVLSSRDINGEIEERTKRVEDCMLRSGIEYCHEYAKIHTRPKSDEAPSSENGD
ncbi:hypothetical protein HII12_004669 [Brettanomyces bruxellensis]|uniref:Beta-mannosyltransferase n=2 Tax=Dekkera bruxellensis TaxID=5007 RepID=A0A8H6ER07_DEKBR|nr:hypothetical protein HII12_004669 [Brettanomyces bruxellensis]